MQANQSQPNAARDEVPEFKIGQLVSVDWDKLGEITEYLWNGYYRVWIEGDRPGMQYATVHAKRLDVI